MTPTPRPALTLRSLLLVAAVVSLAVGAIAGLALAWFSAPWLIAVGAVCQIIR